MKKSNTSDDRAIRFNLCNCQNLYGAGKSDEALRYYQQIQRLGGRVYCQSQLGFRYQSTNNNEGLNTFCSQTQLHPESLLDVPTTTLDFQSKRVVQNLCICRYWTKCIQRSFES